MSLVPQPLAIHGGAASQPVDLSASLNPLGPSPPAEAAARRAALERYPAVDAWPLVAAAASRHSLPRECVVAVPGASWGLWLTAATFLRPGDLCLALGPCFGEYQRCAGIAGADFVEVRCPFPDQRWRAATLTDALAGAPAVCFLANPANPAGTALPASVLRRLCSRHPRTLFVVDEAFVAFAPAATSLVDGRPPPGNALVIRSLTKELGLPGLRMGYAVAEAKLASRLLGVMPAWPLSAPALAAAVAGLADESHVRQGADLARRHLDRAVTRLRRSGAQVIESDANYVMWRGGGAAARLAAAGITVRDCASFGLPGWYRMSAPRRDDLEVVLEAIGG